MKDAQWMGREKSHSPGRIRTKDLSLMGTAPMLQLSPLESKTYLECSFQSNESVGKQLLSCFISFNMHHLRFRTKLLTK